MNKRIILIMMTIMIFSLVACGNEKVKDDNEKNNSKKETNQPEIKYDSNDLDSMIKAVESECEATSQSITTKSEDVLEKLGNTYESYDANKNILTEFYEETLKDSTMLYERIQDINVDYYKCVANNYIEDYDEWYDALEEYYDTLDESLEEFYDIWNKYYDDIYDKCDYLIETADDILEYEEYSEVRDNMYDNHEDAFDDMYDAQENACKIMDNIFSSILDGFNDGNSDVDELIKQAGKEKNENEPKTENDVISEDVEITPDEENDADATEPVEGLRPEFKEAMDSYEEFYDEYCDFMKKYQENPTDATLLTEYYDMIQKMADMDEEFEAWEEEDLNNEELKYYIEVSSRISQKLIDVAS